MRDILDPQYALELNQYRHPKTLIAFDYDGTLAPIVADREQTSMRALTRKLLFQISTKYKTAVISGRAREDLLVLLGDLPIADAVGNHGCEMPGLDVTHAITTVNTWAYELSAALGDLEGIDIENKRLSIAIHYRFAPRDSADRIQREMMKLKGARIIGGKKVLNAVPIGLPNKGDALIQLCQKHRSQRFIFVGDDDTDEDIFALHSDLRGLGIRVGHSEASGANFFIHDQLDIESLMIAILRDQAVT